MANSTDHRPQFMTINNPNFTGLCEMYSHLEGVKVNEDPQNRDQIPVHVVLGASEYAAVKTQAAQKVGLPGQPTAEKILLRWLLRYYSPNQPLTTTSNTAPSTCSDWRS